MAQAHDQSVCRLGGDLQFVRESASLDDEAVIAIGRKWYGQIMQNALPVVVDQAGFAMHRLRSADHPAAVNLPDGLMSQANAQRGNARPELPDDFARETRFIGGAWPRRNHDLAGLHSRDFVQTDLIVARHGDLRAQFRQVLVQVVGETIVIVN